jgi:hypothetical protein
MDTVLFPTVVIQAGNYPAHSGLEETIAPIYPGLQLPSAWAVKSRSFRASEITFFYPIRKFELIVGARLV